MQEKIVLLGQFGRRIVAVVLSILSLLFIYQAFRTGHPQGLLLLLVAIPMAFAAFSIYRVSQSPPTEAEYLKSVRSTRKKLLSFQSRRS